MEILPRAVYAVDMGDPRINILVCGAIVVFALFVPMSLAAMALVLVYTSGTYAVSAGARDTARHFLRLLPFALLVVAINAVIVSGDTVFRLFASFAVSRQGLQSGVFLAARLGVIVTAAAALVRMTPPERFARALYLMACPVSPTLARRAALYGFLSMSFVPLFADEFERIRIAQSFRGGGLRGGLWHRAASIRLIVLPLILSAIHRSGQLAMVVELRELEMRLGDIATLSRPSPGALLFLGASVAILVVAGVVG